MECPKCSGELERKSTETITLDRCNSCMGLLITPEMLNEMLITPASEGLLDTGSPHLGKKYDAVDDIDCPICSITMSKIVDPIQTHIWMEECPKCLRIWLDAGEFSDLKFDTFSDKIKNLLKGKREVD